MHGVDAQVGESAEALLAAYTDAVRCGRSGAAAQLLGKLLRDHAEPVIGKVTRLKLFSRSFRGQSYHAHDEEDVRSTVTLQLISRLKNPASSGASGQRVARRRLRKSSSAAGSVCTVNGSRDASGMNPP